MVNRYNLFVRQVVKAWREPHPRRLQIFHHLGQGRFMVARARCVRPSRLK